MTVATLTTSKFSSIQACLINASSLSSITIAIRSWDSEIANSVPVKPSYFFKTASKLIFKPGASSPTATQTPPAPKSLQRTIFSETALFLNNLWIFLSSTGLPFWTSAPAVVVVFNSWDFDDPVAPPIPSRPVLPPINKTIWSFNGSNRLTWSFGAAATTAPSSIRFATNPSS